MQKPYIRLQARKLPILLHRRIWPTLEICGSSVPPFPKVPCFHQINVYIKRKLRLWGTQKCNFLVGAETVPTVTGPQTTYSHARPYMANIGNLLQFGASNPQGTVFAPNQCLYQNKLRVWGTQKCNFLVGAETVPTVTGPQTTYSHAPPYMANIGNLRQFGASNPQGTVFAPNQCLYQKEATGVGDPKM